MNIKDSKNKEIKSKKQQAPRLRSVQPRVSAPQMRPSLADNYYKNNSKPQIISGYFIEDKSYKEYKISKVNTVLSWIIAGLVFVSMLSYYFVITCEQELNRIRKETIVKVEENEELEIELYKKMSYDNIEKHVSSSNNLGRSYNILKVPAKGDSKARPVMYINGKAKDWTYGF